jgi:hypothetical protein
MGHAGEWVKGSSSGVISLLIIVNQRRSTDVTEVSAISKRRDRVISSDFLQKLSRRFKFSLLNYIKAPSQREVLLRKANIDSES